MPDSFYRSGQAAKQLGISSYHVRRLCEVGEIDAELTKGQQWRIPASEVARLSREGIPDIPAESEDLEDESNDGDSFQSPTGLLAAPSDKVIDAAEEVKIVESRLQTRRIEKQAEELEDWFREREQRQAAQEAAERRRAEAARAEQFRRKWTDAWMQYALKSRPYDAPRETELEIHQEVQRVLAGLQPDQPQHVVQRLVDAAVAKALRPWHRKKEIRGALESALNRLPWEVNHRPEWATLKNRTWEAAVVAIGKLTADSTSGEMEAAAWQAMEPMAKEFAHWQNCQNLAAWIILPGGTYDQQQEACQEVRETLARLPVGTALRELEKTKAAVLERHQAAIQQRRAAELQREEAARNESERARQRANAESRVDRRLSWRLGDCIRELEEAEEIECENVADRWELENDLKKRIRPMLLSQLLQAPEMSDDKIDERLEGLARKHIWEFLDD
jgi:excisionase family DNA binding protein